MSTSEAVAAKEKRMINDPAVAKEQEIGSKWRVRGR